MPQAQKASDEQIAAAVARIEAKEISLRGAARELGIDHSTLSARRDKLKGEADGLDLASFSGSDGFVEIPVIRRKYDADHHYVYPLGDVHLGAAAHDAEAWKRWREYLLENERASMLGTGDFLNTAIKEAVSDIYEETLNPRDGRKLLANQLQPLADEDRIDVMKPGNHENRITKAIGDCPIEIVSEIIGVPYVPASVLIVYEIGDVEYTFFSRHGTGNGQSVAAAEKAAAMIHADVYVTAHIHSQFVKSDEVFALSDDGLRVERQRRHFVGSGSFLRLERYAAERGYKAGRIGAPRIRLNGERKDVHVSL